MNIQLILLIIGLALIFFLAFKLLKGIIKAMIVVFIISIILVVATGFIIYLDASTIKQGFQGESKIIITQDKEFITAFGTNDLTLKTALKQEFFKVPTEDEMIILIEKYEEEKYDEIVKDELLLILDQKTFYEDEIIVFGSKRNFTENDLNQIAKSKTKEDIKNILADISEEELIKMDDLTIDEIKGTIYFSLFQNKLKDTKGKFIIDGIKEKNINTKPQLISIKLLNFFPEKIMNKLVNEE